MDLILTQKKKDWALWVCRVCTVDRQVVMCGSCPLCWTQTKFCYVRDISAKLNYCLIFYMRVLTYKL